MLLIPCPWCGPRDEREFVHGGTQQDAAGQELWRHRHGCGQWFVAVRDPRTQAFARTAPLIPLADAAETAHGA